MGIQLKRLENQGKRMAPQVGLEPTTLRLTAGCSAIELLRSVVGGLGTTLPEQLSHHIKAWSPAKVARTLPLFRLAPGAMLAFSQARARTQFYLHFAAHRTVQSVYFCRFDLSYATCYKCPFCTESRLRPCFVFPGPLSARTESDAAKLSTPIMSCSGSVFGTPAMRLPGGLSMTLGGYRSPVRGT